MLIEVKTATDNCSDKCPYFKVETIDLYQNGNIYHRSHKCEHYDMCSAIYDDIRREYGGAE